MIYPDEKVPEVCKLGPVAASELLARGRAGDLQALADWAVYSAYRSLLRVGIPPAVALRKLRDLLPAVNLKPCIVP